MICKQADEGSMRCALMIDMIERTETLQLLFICRQRVNIRVIVETSAVLLPVDGLPERAGHRVDGGRWRRGTHFPIVTCGGAFGTLWKAVDARVRHGCCIAGVVATGVVVVDMAVIHYWMRRDW